jgi:hypothetical protein
VPDRVGRRGFLARGAQTVKRKHGLALACQGFCVTLNVVDVDPPVNVIMPERVTRVVFEADDTTTP